MNVTCIGPRCNGRAVQRHHVCYQAELRKRWESDVRKWKDDPDLIRVPWPSLDALRGDDRNMIPTCVRCHARHHNRLAPFPVWVLPDSVFEFAAELMGGGAAHNYISRFYSGGDPRLDALLEMAA